MSTPEIVTDGARLATLCDAWRAAGRLAFDTEFIRDETFDAALCLVQVSDGENVVLVDPTGGLDVRPFWDLVCDPAVMTIVHAGKEDFEVCLRSTGQVPRNVFDVQIAAGLVGYDYPMSLSRLAEAVLRRRIAKGQTMTDWLRRPLTEEQLHYAVEDVAHLPAIYDRLQGKLRKHKREAWAAEEFERFEHAEYYRAPSEDRAQKLKGAKKLDGLGLAVLGRLVEWRDEWAQSRNRPIRALMRDDVLVEIARRRPTKADQLNIIRGFHQSRNKQVVAGLLSAIAEAARTPPEEWPTPHQPRDDSPMTKAATDILSAVMRGICHEQGVAQELVGSSQRLRDLVDYARQPEGPQPALLRGWRGAFVGQALLQVLDGHSEVHFSGWPDQPRIRVVNHGNGKP
jgi:ribonuclease D